MKLSSTVLSLALVAVLNLPAGAQMGAPASMTARAFSAAPAGSTIDVVVRVTRRVRASVRGEVLERVTEGVYRRTGTRVELFLTDDVPFVMGAATDVAPGAVVHADGVLTAKGHADAKRIVILTRYVTVEPAQR